MVSRRAHQLIKGEPFLVKAHFDSELDRFHLEHNPDGYINLGTAENHLLWDLLAPKINEIQYRDSRTTHYDYLFGSSSFRSAVAKYLQRHSKDRVIDQDSLVITSGSSAAIEMLIYSLCEPGDGVLIPSPYYAGFDFDLTARCGAIPIPIALKSESGFSLSVHEIEKTYLEARVKGIRPRILLITSPNNPLGKVYGQCLIEEIIDFCETYGLECIFDEVYANSCFGETFFTSSLSYDSPVVHTVYSFAKDFALSGFKIGVAHSPNPDLTLAMRSMCYFSPVSTHTQEMMTQLLNQEDWISDLINTNKKRLSSAYRFVTLALDRYGLPFCEVAGGLFVLVDLRSKLETYNFEAELKLWRRLFYDGKLNTSPGSVFHCAEPGFFRICFAQEESVLRHGVVRLQKTLRQVSSRAVSVSRVPVPGVPGNIVCS